IRQVQGKVRYLLTAHDSGPSFPPGRMTGTSQDARFWLIDKERTRMSPSGIETNMKFKNVEPQQFDCRRTVRRPFGCMELWAGNERAHRSLDLAGLESDVIAVPSGGDKGGDLSAVFSCSDNTARVVLADCVGHGYTASGVARHVHRSEERRVGEEGRSRGAPDH